jgi:hypothetical protein
MEKTYHIPKMAESKGCYFGKPVLLISRSKFLFDLFALGQLFLFSREEHV